MAKDGRADSPGLHVACAAAPGTDAAAAATICQEFAAFLQDRLPGQAVIAGAGAPGLDVTVTTATPRALAMTLDWIAADGSRMPGLPMRTSFFDRNSDPDLRAQFFTRFLQRNPLPF
jgi:hypothetical protein